jgi:hypothetical protein
MRVRLHLDNTRFLVLELNKRHNRSAYPRI